MALVFMDGFDLRNGIASRGWAQSQQGSSVSYIAGSLGGYSFNILAGTASGDNYYIAQALPSTYSEMVWGVRFSTDIQKSDQDFFRFGTSAGAVIATIRIDATTQLLSVRNSSDTLIATGFRKMLNGYHYLEFRLKINGASGECEVFVDGTEEIATTVSNFGSTNIGQLQIYARAGSAFTRTLNVDDIYALDTTGGAPLNTFLGDSQIETLMPTSDGANTAWTPNSGGTEYTQVDETPYDGDTTHIYDSTPGNISTFGCANLSFASGTVYAVQPNLAARKDDATLREIRPVIRQGGVNYSVGTVVALSTSYVLYTSLLPLDPVAATWTAANVNADEFGVELVT